MTTVSPGAASPASSTADFSCADGNRRLEHDRDRVARAGERQRQAAVARRPAYARRSAPADRAPAASAADASEASPSNVAVIGQPATAPSISRQPVPELPKSSGSRRRGEAARRRRRGRCHSPAPSRSTRAPSARTALPVLSTSSPSSKPLIRVSPTASAPRISARCEIDLSPGTRTRPLQRAAPAGGQRGWWRHAS